MSNYQLTIRERPNKKNIMALEFKCNNVKKLVIDHICYSKQNCVPTPHTKFGLNKNMPNYNRFHVN